MAEDWRDNAFNQAIGKYILQPEFNFTGIGPQRDKVPVARQLFEWTIDQADIHVMRKLFVIARGEVLLYAMVADMDGRLGGCVCAFVDFAASTPRQKCRIVFYSVHQTKHGLTGVHYQDCFFDVCHVKGVKWGFELKCYFK